MKNELRDAILSADQAIEDVGNHYVRMFGHGGAGPFSKPSDDPTLWLFHVALSSIAFEMSAIRKLYQSTLDQ